jgi:predicted amidohydrolase
VTGAAFTVIRENELPLEPPKGIVRLASVQMDVAIARAEENADRVIAAMEVARGERASLAAFPECALTGYCFDGPEEALAASLDPDGPVIGRLAAAAARLGMYAAVGYLERVGDAPANAVSVIGPRGVVAHYRKTHLPVLGVDKWTTPGRGPLAVQEAAGLRLGLLICYDASFPEAVRLLALEGADLVLLPTNWPEEADHKAAWLPNTRAYENVIYFAAVNRIGRERGYTFHGKSRVCAPTGETLAEAPPDREAILVTDVDPARSRQKRIERRGSDYWVDRIGQRRTDLYRLEPGSGSEEDSQG